MAAKGIPFPRRWYGGMISANLEVIWVMSVKKATMEVVLKKTLLAGISAVAVAASGSAWAFAEVEAAFVPEDPLANHQIVATSCEQPQSFRRIEMKGGTKFARTGEVFAFEPRVIRAKRCEEVEIVLENTDAVRHALMLPGLNPMFALEFTGRGVKSLRFVTPDEDVTLKFHCHVPTHERLGMLGELIVGKGGKPPAHEAPPAGTARLFEGIGVVVAVEPRENRLVLTHGEIKGFKAAMVEMSYMVTPATLLKGIDAGNKVRFTINADKRAIVGVVRLDR